LSVVGITFDVNDAVVRTKIGGGGRYKRHHGGRKARSFGADHPPSRPSVRLSVCLSYVHIACVVTERHYGCRGRRRCHSNAASILTPAGPTSN